MRWEWPLVISILLIAFFFRVWMLNDVPPGLHHDEVIIGQVAKDILRGHFAIYFTPGYGHEPLYHYVVAGMFGAIGANAFVLRLTSAFIALLGLAAAYRFIRLIFSPAVAIGMLAWMSISLWPVFFARVGLRGITLPLLTTLTAYFLWRALFGRRAINHGPQAVESSALNPARIPAEGRAGRSAQPSAFVLPGILLGLSIYTYQASRVFLAIFAAFLVYLFVLRRLSKRSSSFILHPSSLTWRAVVVFFLAAFIVAAPLIFYLTVVNPSAESRVADLSEPLNKLLAGDPGEVIGSTLNTLGMFTFRGDAVPIYNLSGRPVFPEIVGAALFIIGMLICLWRWRQPACALMLIWFFVSLGPAMVTPFSPNFVRTIASWPVPFVFVGLAMAKVTRWISARNQMLRHLVVGLFALVLIYNAASTFSDYFVHWSVGDYVRFWQQATWTQAVRTLNADQSSTPIAASGLSIQDFEPGADFDPQTFELLGLRSDLKVKWFDCRSAMLYPGGVMQWSVRYLISPFFSCDADLWSRYLPSAEVTVQPHWPDNEDTIFALYQFSRTWSLNALLMPRTVSPPLFTGPEQFQASSLTSDLVQVHTPLEFNGLRFWGITAYGDKFGPGDKLEFDSFWELLQPIVPPLKIFIHITAPDGKIIAQWDGLDVNVGTLDPGDLFVQRHRIKLPDDLPAGPYRISIGAYHADNGTRLQANLDGRTIDSIVLGMLTVQ